MRLCVINDAITLFRVNFKKPKVYDDTFIVTTINKNARLLKFEIIICFYIT